MAGNARFHNKWHRRSHHSSPSIGYPDSATDPIASPAEPFQGDFVLTGNLSAHKNLFVDGNATVLGNLSVLGDFTYLDTIVTVTSALSVVNRGTGPALTVEQWGEQPIARFVDADAPDGQREALYIDNDGLTVIDGTVPASKYDPTAGTDIPMNLTINGNAYATKSFIYEKPEQNCIFVSTSGSDTNSGLNPSQKVRTIKKAAKIAFDVYGTNKCAIYVETGDYTENNPIYIPAGTTVLGEGNLRRTILRPYNKQLDFFWVNTACYINGFTFRDTWEPCAATAFPNLLSGTPAYKVAFQTPGYEIDTTKPGGPFGLPIVSKPYVTTSPYIQGCSSITRYQAVPIQPTLYPSYYSPDTQVFFPFDESSNVTALMGILTDTLRDGAVPPYPTILPPTFFTLSAIDLINAARDTIQDNTIAFVNSNSPPDNYDQAKCRRDIGYIIDAVIDGLESGTATEMGIAADFYLHGAYPPPIEALPADQVQPSINAFNYVRDQLIDVIQPGYLEASNIELSFNIITNIIGGGTPPDPVSTTPTIGQFAATVLLASNIAFIQEAAVKYVDYNYPSLAYNKALYYTDMGNIVQEVINDLTNSTTASAIGVGLSYLSNDTIVQTIDAINFAKSMALDVVRNRLLLTYEQRFNGSYALGDQAKPYINSDFNTITGILRTGVIPSVITYTPPPGNADAAYLLTLNRPFIQKTTINFVDKNFPGFAYDKAVCERDTGLITDCIVRDLQEGTNMYAISAGSKYFKGNTSVIRGQEIPTIAAINYINFLSQKIVTNTIAVTGQSYSPYLSSGLDASADVYNSFDTITNIIITGDTSKVPYYHAPLPGASDAATLLQLNRTFIQKEVIAYIGKAYPTFVYDKDLCERDTGYIIDAVIYDVTNGTNLSAIDAGNHYYSGVISLITGQEIQTVAAINYAKYLAKYIIDNAPAKYIGAGCGIRVDGELAFGFLRSFVTDSFTQFNAGGKGIHVINCGYAQLVSTFTICTTEGVMTESGGQCSISTSNCSFGLSGLVADGLSKFPVLTGYQYESTPLGENFIYLKDVTPRPLSAFIAALQANTPISGIPVDAPYNGLLILAEGDPASNFDPDINPNAETVYHGIKSVSALDVPFSYKITLEKNTTAPLTASEVEPRYVELYLRSQIASSSHAFEYIGTGIDLELAVPALGGLPINENEAVYSNNGIVYWSSTNERGDFKVGGGFTIKQEKGTVEGIDFNKSILALVTPLILSLE
jgi:hypothetical protein